jgi:hypothetical protein
MKSGAGKKSSSGKWILLFDSIHFVMQAEKALKTGGFAVEIIPVPRSLSSDCGMAVEFSGLASDLKKILANPAVKCRKLYRESSSKYDEERF